MLHSRPRAGPTLALVLAAMAAVAPAAGATTQTTADPDDAYALGSEGQSDVRSVEWRVEAGSATLTVHAEASPPVTVNTFLDVDRNGRADYVVNMGVAAGSASYDAALLAVPRSTATCQLLAPGDGAAPLVEVHPAVATDVDGRLELKLAFPVSAIAGATSFAWASFGLTHNGLSPPGWDYAPDAADPAPGTAQPADRACVVPKAPGYEDAPGERLDLTHGVEFPTPTMGDLPPTAGFTSAPGAPLSGDAITLTSTSSDAEGPLASQRWDLDDDGLYDDATGPTATTSFARRGPHTVSLLVEDSAGATATASHVIAVGNRPPVVSLSADPNPAQPDQTVVLSSTSTDDGDIAAYAWDTDGDGADDATGPVVLHSFPRKGIRSVRLRVTDDDGASAVASLAVRVLNRPPVPALRITPASPRVDELSRLDASGSTDPDGDRLLYQFDPDGLGYSSLTESSLYETYGSSPGRHDVRVRVTDTDGASAVATVPVDFRPPAPLHLAITGGDLGRVVLGDTAQVSGTWGPVTSTAPTAFCATVGRVDAIPATCDLTRALARSGRFEGVSVRGLAPGPNRITVWIRDGYGQVSSASATIDRVSAASGLDLRVASIEVTQGPQFLRLPVPRDPAPGASRTANYDGDKLAYGSPTYARVFANARSLPQATGPRNVTALLHGYGRFGREYADSPISPLATQRRIDLGPLAGVPDGARADERGGYVFELPDDWTRSPELTLHAEVNPPDARPALPECGGCYRDNAFTLNRILFFSPPYLNIVPLRLIYGPTGREIVPPAPDVAFQALRATSPGGASAVGVSSYAATIDISPLANDPRLSADQLSNHALGTVVGWQMLNGALGYVVGVNRGLLRGLNAPVPIGIPPHVESLSIVNTDRPLTSVGHETWHAYGFFHASPCGNPGLFFDDWLPDQEGRLEGYAVDTRPGSGGSDGPLRVIGPQGYDLMSYCANSDDRDSWISARNWNRRLGGPIDQVPLARAAPLNQPGAFLRVTAGIGTDGEAELIGVEGFPAAPATPPASQGYAMVVRDASGGILETVPASVSELEKHGHDSGPIFLQAIVPAASAASVDLVGPAGTVLATRTASATAPVVQVRRPRVRRRALAVGWTASDPDGDPVTIRVDLAEDGVTFRTVLVDPRGTRATVPLAGLGGGRHARVRVVVNDGFREASAVSGAFSLPNTPDVRILAPAKRSALTSDAAVVLRGEAVSTGRRPRLSWYAGRRLLGHGRALSLPGLPAGRVRLRLVAGRASAAVRVRVRAAPLRLIELAARRRGTRHAVLRVAADQPAVLHVASRRVAVDRRPRRLVVPARGKRRIRLRLTTGRRALAVSVRPR